MKGTYTQLICYDGLRVFIEVFAPMRASCKICPTASADAFPDPQIQQQRKCSCQRCPYLSHQAQLCFDNPSFFIALVFLLKCVSVLMLLS